MLGEVLLGELLCESLVEAEDAPLLQLAISVNEVSVLRASRRRREARGVSTKLKLMPPCAVTLQT